MERTKYFSASGALLSHWYRAELVAGSHFACLQRNPSPTTAHPAWPGLVAALGLAVALPHQHPVPRFTHLIDVRLTGDEWRLLTDLSAAIPVVHEMLEEER
ncbi:hypothetical protein JOF53_000029 [Crossiella equi]|uniref:Uncharacterized protein n=1 Tax=Crossiella equi TaxID=130796 RepID=A0ABS5A3K5_9PSEU|nr:hypothetical protein [Crossiella equi]MBP2471157.1 hypothetical protein [Crossiella equi]